MPRAPKKVGGKASQPQVIVVNPAETEDEMPVKTDEELQAEEEIEEASSESPRQAEATIWRADADTGEHKFCAKVAAGTVNHDWLAKRFGGGKFLVRFKKPDATGRRLVYDHQKWFHVDESVMPVPTQTVYNPDGSIVGTPGVDPMATARDAAMLSFIQTMNASVNAQLTSMRETSQLTMTLMERLAKPREISPALTAVLAAIGPALPSLAEKLLGKGDNTMEIVRTVLELAKPAPTNSMKETLEVVALIREQFGDSAPTDSMGLLDKGLSVISGMVGGAQNRQPAAPEHPALPAPQQVDPAQIELPMTPAPQPTTPVRRFPSRLWRDRIVSNLPQLLSFRAFLSPENAAEQFADNASDVEWKDFENDRAAGAVGGLTFVERSVAAICEGQKVSDDDVRWLVVAMNALEALEMEPEPGETHDGEGA